MSFVIQLIGALVTLTVLFWFYVKWAHTYWARKNVPYIEPTSIVGNIENPFAVKRGFLYDVKKVHDELKKRGHKHGGMYLLAKPAYVPVDTELIKQILTRDFQYFLGHGLPVDANDEPLTGHLFNLDGDEWRDMRTKFSPTFTSGKMKMMFDTLIDCGFPMLEHIGKLSENQDLLNTREILSCFTTDVIGSCAFGLKCNSFLDPNAEFRKYIRQILAQSNVFLFLQFGFTSLEWIRKKLGIRVMAKEVESFFLNVIKDVMDNRKVNNIQRNDFIQLFMEINKKVGVNSKEALTLEQIAAQSFVFFLAGFETSATTMTFCLHELAFNEHIQNKLREEVRKTMNKHGGKLTYDGIMEMKYMDQVVNETLRKYPPVPIINRVCTADYKVPGTQVIIEAGTKVFISALGLHRDEEYFPNPERFDPERFSDENKSKRPTFAFLPFGEGPRICIGLRFGTMQTKTGLSMILNSYKILPVEDGPYNLELNPKAFVMDTKETVMLKAERLSI